jgi:hypothetical protein
MAPEPLEIVISAGCFRENMDDEVAVVHQYPLSRVITFYADWQLAGFLQLLRHFVGNGVRLPRVGDRAEYEVIGK